jgi:hypothetical protein
MYMNAVLTVIAVALVALVAQQFTSRASAAVECGLESSPCWVMSKYTVPACGTNAINPCFVRVVVQVP